MEEKNRFKLSWELFRRSVSVMFRNKLLLVFPIVIMMLMAVVTIFFLMPVVGAVVVQRYQPGLAQHAYQSLVARHWIDPVRWKNYYEWLSANHWQNAKPVAAGYFLIMYFASMVCATFFNVAFYYEIIEALKGHRVSIRGGLRFAWTRWKAILLWSAFAGLAGYLIRTLEQRFGLFGKLVMAIVGTAWSVACVFAIPIIILDETTWNPVAVLKKSVTTLRRTWGESLVGYVGISFANAIVTAAALLWVGGALALAYKLKSITIAGLAVMGGLLPLVIFLYLTSMANQIFRCALYLYASTGSMPRPFSSDMAALAWKRKKT